MPNEDMADLRERLTLARIALSKYGRHLQDCLLFNGGTFCSCGYTRSILSATLKKGT